MDLSVWCQSDTFTEVDVSAGEVTVLPCDTLDDVLTEVTVSDFETHLRELADEEELQPVPVMELGGAPVLGSLMNINVERMQLWAYVMGIVEWGGHGLTKACF